MLVFSVGLGVPFAAAFQRHVRPLRTGGGNLASSSSSSSSLAAIRDPTDAVVQREMPRRPLQTPVTTFATITEYLDAIDSAPPNALTVVLYFAHYCKMCQQANIPFKKLAYGNPPDVTFARLETSLLTPNQFRSLGISRVPFVQIFRNGICVASFSTQQWRLGLQLRDTLLECQGRSVGGWRAFCARHDDDIQANREARERLRAEALQLVPAEEAAAVTTLAAEGQLVEAVRATRGSDTPSLVVLFHSHFVQSCVRAQRQYRRIAEQPHRRGRFVMTRVERSVLSDSTLKDLGIERYPHVQVYRDGICVASFSVPQTYFFTKLVGDSLDAIASRTPEEWSDFVRLHRQDIDANKAVQEVIQRRQLSP